MRLGATDSDAYLEGWRQSEWEERDGSPEQVAQAVAQRTRERIRPRAACRRCSTRTAADATLGSRSSQRFKEAVLATVAKRRFIRADGPDKVTGSGRYTADLNLTGMLHAKFKFAGVSHGRITRLDTSKAEALPGVFAVATHADVPDVLYGDFVQDRHLFCKEYVRYEGDIVAAVAALTPEIAQQAVDLIEVEYEKLPVVNDLEAALAPDAPLVHVDWASYGDTDGMVRDRNDASHSTIVKGDIEQGMRDADLVDQEPLRGRRLARRSRSSRAPSWRSGRATTSRSGPRRRCRSRRAAASWTRSSCPPARCASSCRSWAAASAASAASTTRRTSPCSRARRRARSSSCSRAARSSSLPTSAARAWSSRSRAASRRTARSPRAAAIWSSTTAPTRRTRRSSRSSRPCTSTGRTRRRARSSTRIASTRTTSRPARCARPRRRRPAGRSSSTPTSWRPRSAWIPSSSAARTASTPATRARRGRSTCRSACTSASPTPPR